MSARRSARISKKSNQKSQCGSSSTSVGSGPLDKYLLAPGSSKRKQAWLTPPDQEDKEVEQNSSKRRQQYQIQNQWQPIASCQQISTRTLVPSPLPPARQVPCTRSMMAAGASCYTFRNIFTCQNSRCPLPPLKWGDPQDVWNVMKAKEGKYIRDKNMLQRHPQLQYRMRAILLDWIIEVCEVYRLHRETFYLASDFVDRYLSLRENVQKYQLQLIGVTALFIAAKIEEIYPPKIVEFAYVTDGACTEDDITKQELIMLKSLEWDLCPMTVNTWMTLYLNILNMEERAGDETCLTMINYSRHSYLRIVRLMDLCTLDEGSLQFPTSILAAAVLYHFGSEATAHAASGYTFDEIERCAGWLAPFAITTREHTTEVKIKAFEHVLPEDHHNIQTHDVSVFLLDKARARQQAMILASRASPNITDEIPGVLTPPPTKHKHSARAESTSVVLDKVANSLASESTSRHGRSGEASTGERRCPEDLILVYPNTPSLEDLCL